MSTWIAMNHFDAHAELARIQALRKKRRYRRSRLDRFRSEILALRAAGASCADIALWLRGHKTKAVGSTVARYIARQEALLAENPGDDPCLPSDPPKAKPAKPSGN